MNFNQAEIKHNFAKMVLPGLLPLWSFGACASILGHQSLTLVVNDFPASVTPVFSRELTENDGGRPALWGWKSYINTRINEACLIILLQNGCHEEYVRS